MVKPQFHPGKPLAHQLFHYRGGRRRRYSFQYLGPGFFKCRVDTLVNLTNRPFHYDTVWLTFGKPRNETNT